MNKAVRKALRRYYRKNYATITIRRTTYKKLNDLCYSKKLTTLMDCVETILNEYRETDRYKRMLDALSKDPVIAKKIEILTKLLKNFKAG